MFFPIITVLVLEVALIVKFLINYPFSLELALFELHKHVGLNVGLKQELKPEQKC